MSCPDPGQQGRTECPECEGKGYPLYRSGACLRCGGSGLSPVAGKDRQEEQSARERFYDGSEWEDQAEPSGEVPNPESVAVTDLGEEGRCPDCGFTDCPERFEGVPETCSSSCYQEDCVEQTLSNDCFRACVATITGIDPLFLPNPQGPDWFGKWVKALREIGLVIKVHDEPRVVRDGTRRIVHYPLKGLWIAEVPSLNLGPGVTHAIVMNHDRIWHDPSTNIKRTGWAEGEDIFRAYSVSGVSVSADLVTVRREDLEALLGMSDPLTKREAHNRLRAVLEGREKDSTV